MAEVDAEARRQFWQARPDLIRPEAERRFGEPNKGLSTPYELRFGKRGSVVVNLHGDKPGAWFDHEKGEGGLLPIPEADFRAMKGGGRPGVLWRSGTSRLRPAASQDDREADLQRQAEGIARATQIWNETVPLRGTLGEHYLRTIRGRDPAGIDDLRFHVGLSCLVAAMRNIYTGQVTAVHRTYVDVSTGANVGRRMRGVAADAAIMLDPFDATLYGLAICEGVEDGLAARGMFRPVWALASAGAIAKFAVLPGIETLTIFADADAAGQRAAAECAERWAAAGRKVTIHTPVRAKDIDEASR